MHIVYVTIEFPTEITGGGLSSYLGNMAGILAGLGHKVTVITLSNTNERIKYQENIYVERVCIPHNKFIKQFNRLRVESFFLNLRLRRLIKSEKVDIVQYPNCRASGLFRTSLPSVVRVSSDAFLWRCADEIDMDVALKEGANKRNKEEYLEDKALIKADRVFGPSEVIGDYIGRRINKEIQIIESPYFKVKFNNSELYEKYLRGKRYLLTACSLRRTKGIHVIASAIFTILDKHPDLYYVLAGENELIKLETGEMRNGYEYVREAAGKHKDRLIYLGNISKELLNPVIMHAYGVVLPSRIDNLPNSCIEAMGEGRVVIGTKGASFEQLIKDGESGLLIRRDSVDSLIEKIEELLRWTEEKWSAVGENARKRISLMNAEATGEKMLKLYYETIRE